MSRPKVTSALQTARDRGSRFQVKIDLMEAAMKKRLDVLHRAAGLPSPAPPAAAVKDGQPRAGREVLSCRRHWSRGALRPQGLQGPAGL